jgi:hypothetical protein
LCSLLQPLATSSLLGPNILLSAPFSDTLNLCEFWGFYGGKDSSRSLLGHDVVEIGFGMG